MKPCTSKAQRRLSSGLAALLMVVPALAGAQAWKPDRPIEIVIGTSPGGGIDQMCRLTQKLLQDQRWIDFPLNVVNKPGAGQAVGYTYLNTKAGDGHFIGVSSPALVTNFVTGRSTIRPTDVTPLAQLAGEYVAFAVRADSPIRTARDLVERLRDKPDSLSLTPGGVLGSAIHIGMGQMLKAGGVDVKRLKMVAFNSGADGITAVLGGHVDVIGSVPYLFVPQVQAGKMRVLGVAAPKRLPGAFAEVPTWREQGYDAVSAYWRGMIGPRGMTPAQVAFWDDILARLSRHPEWVREMDRRTVEITYLPSAESRRFLEANTEEMRRSLTELGLIK